MTEEEVNKLYSEILDELGANDSVKQSELKKTISL